MDGSSSTIPARQRSRGHAGPTAGRISGASQWLSSRLCSLTDGPVDLADENREPGSGEALPSAALAVSDEVFAQSAADAEPPECIQLVDRLPRLRTGEIRLELLQLVASNQLDQIDQLIVDATEREIVGAIIAQRRNLADRF